MHAACVTRRRGAVFAFVVANARYPGLVDARAPTVDHNPKPGRGAGVTVLARGRMKMTFRNILDEF